MLNVIIAVGAAAVLVWPFPAAIKQTVDSTYAIGAHGALKVVTPSGDIGVKTWDGDTVRVTQHKRALTQAVLDALKIDVSTANGDVEIATTYPHNCTDCDLSLDIQVPRGVSVAARSSSGDIRVTGIHGKLTLAASSGDISVAHAGGSVAADASSGTIRIDGADGAVHCWTASGDIKATGMRGDLDAHAASGEVDARFDELGAVRAIVLSASDGNVTISMPRGAGATIDASTISGSIRSDFGVNPQYGYAGATLAQTTGDGRVRIRLSTASGDVALRAL